MKKLFVLQNNAQADYGNELRCCIEECFPNQSVDQLPIDELSVEYLINNSVQVVVSTAFDLEWYLKLKGLKIVTIVFDNLEENFSHADIVIDHKSKDSNKYFTGSSYSICQGHYRKSEFQDILDLITKLEWDSNFFGHNTAFLSCRHLTENIIHHLNQFIKNEHIDVVEYLCNCHDQKSVLLAEKNNFRFTDIRLTFEKKLSGVTESEVSPYEFKLATVKDIPELKRISAHLYQDSRYYFDGSFSKEKIDEFYQNWVEKAVLGTFDDACYALFDGEQPACFCTVNYPAPDKANIGLFGVSSSYQGNGLAKILINAVTNELFGKGVTRVKVVTQGRNYPAQRAYQKAGFLTKSTELWYHKWTS